MDLSPDEDNFQGRLLHQAALWDNVELLAELIAAGADVNARDALSRTALHAAALAERSSCLRALCAAGADLDTVSSHGSGGKTALHIAAERGHVENARVLLAAGASLGVLDAAGDSALALAERRGHRHAAAALREAKDALERERLLQHAQLRELVCRGDLQAVKGKLQALGPEAGLIVNLTPGGANTLLYVAAESGHTSVVSALLEAGADGRAHPVTKYCPLYIVCYRGHAETAKLLLHAYPQAAQQETVEKWLPLHAACIGGHPTLVNLLLEFPYPESMLSTYTVTGQCRYRAAFDVNARDVSGQTALYVACTLGNLALVETLLAHSVPCWKSEEDTPPPVQPATSPTRGSISMGIHAIVSRLTRANKQETETENRVRPVRVDAGAAGDGCLAAAARGGHLHCVTRLLAAGADPDGPARRAEASGPARSARRRVRSSSALPGRSSTSPSPQRAGSAAERDMPWTALAVAAYNKNLQLLELLLARGATDPHCAALRECARHGLEDAVARLLAAKAFPDPDYKINKATVSEAVFSGRGGDTNLTYNALCPATPVTVNWRELRCQLAKIRMQWVSEAALRVNPRVGSAAAALHAVTRLDVANNELRALPPELFTLLSLRYLNAAQNKIERLPSALEAFEGDKEASRGLRGRSATRAARAAAYGAPVLQDLYLQDNRLEELPPELFSLPSLVTLDVSNNKLRSLPEAMWSAPRLKELNASLNHLRELPTGQVHTEGASPSHLVSPSASASQLSASPSAGNVNPFIFNNSMSKSSSRSPSIERSASETSPEYDDDEDGVCTLGNRAGNAVWTEAKRVHTWRGVVETAEVTSSSLPGSALTNLNISHNQFTRIPPPLACRAPRLQRLSMAYNSLRSMSYVTSYPTSLRQLDLSHNEITCWPSLPQLDSLGSAEGDPLACHCPGAPARGRPRSAGGLGEQLLRAACPARRHLTLEALRTLILSNNMLTRIQLTTDDDGYISEKTRDDSNNEEDEWNTGNGLKGRLMFPLLSMLDVSCNLLRSVPVSIHALSNLAVLNISGNKDITDLPPQMGLLSRLWNLNTGGCNLQEPLRGMLQCGKFRSMDVVGYLKSVLQEARRYTAMRLMLVGLQGIGKTSLLECLRQESAITHRRKPTEHWAKRMGNKSGRRGGNVSTVGVDIGTWLYEKPRSARGPVTFRTWDFGGQQEYYATHQYFLSRRSLYLVVWKVTDGRKGLAGALQWLRSIQARAPGSPVIMVATHYDQVPNCNLPENESPECLQRVIRSHIMGAADADKLGLPRVLDSVEVSCSTRHNIRLLADIIYSIAYSVKPPGSKEPLLEQRVPATYLALEECVTQLASELKEPVLRHDDYKRLVTQYMQQKNHRMFRDAAELHQATMFLHENGVLLHYDDATLRELYFLRPQWLCDVLAHVVTIREINPFASNGIMKMDDLPHVFKASPQLARGDEAGSLGVSLLNKFELALCWDARSLLVPPLLPKTEPARPQLACRARWAGGRGSGRRAWPAAGAGAAFTAAHEPGTRGTDSPTLIHEHPAAISITARDGGRALRRLLLLSYIPCGFWARLVTRLLADDAIGDCAPPAYTLPPEVDVDEGTARALELSWGWKLWQGGLRLCSGALTLARVRALPPRCDALLAAARGADAEGDPDHPYGGLRFRIHQEGVWCDLDAQAQACVELLLPAEVCVARRDDGHPLAGYQSISLEPNPEILAKLLALISDHIDLLLEDWYPSLGTRFVHTSEGRCLITRLVPCPACLRAPEPSDQQNNMAQPISQCRRPIGLVVCPPTDDPFLARPQALRRLELGGGDAPRRIRLSEESRTSDGDSGVGAESNGSSLAGSADRAPFGGAVRIVRAWTHERCILAACTSAPLACDVHGALRLADVAPDALLLDVEESCRARWEEITRGRIVGRGAFGTVLAATWRGRAGALKALQPVAPEPRAPQLAHNAYKAAMSRWEREPAAAACRAYCALRQELAVLTALRHAHVVPLLAACAAPLALLLPLAPRGALDGVLREYRGCGARVGVRAARALALQAARALEYLHARRIVYRDLKSENVLVWAMPKPQEAYAAEASPSAINVHIKLGDYGISRLAPPSGTKGFGGTEGFMAPEIMRYNGEEEYNEKVDCFSFGMLLYEIISLRQPFEGHEAVKEAVLDGARPPLSPRELQYPCNVLATMRQCWSGCPGARPSAAALVSLCAAPEFPALRDAAALPPAAAAAAAAAALHEDAAGGWEVWAGGEAERVHTLLAAPSDHQFTQHYTITLPPDNNEPVVATALCRVGTRMWVGDSAGRVSVYSASTCALQWRVCVYEAVGGAASAVAALAALPSLRRAALALRCGRLFLVTSQRPEAEGSFVLTELGAATELHCLAAVPRGDSWEVWAGGSRLNVYAVNEGGVSGAEEVPDCAGAALLAVACTSPHVLLYSEPGCIVYQWSVRSRRQTAKLDCSKLAPCSESLQSIALDDRLSEENCRVTAMCTMKTEVYIGTAWGCIVVAEAATLRPITIFRPYETMVRAIVPLQPLKGADSGCMVATIGAGYRPLLQRFVPHPQTNNNAVVNGAGSFCLLWRADDWQPD